MLKNKIIIALSLSLISFPALANSHEHHHGHDKKSEHKEHKKEHKSLLNVVLSPKQGSYPKMKPVKLTLKLNDTNKPVEKALISMDLTMPDMSMPKNEVKFKEVSKGVYESDVMFTMSGSWRLVTTISNGNKKEVVNFDVMVD
jgi:hypothetical protein